MHHLPAFAGNPLARADHLRTDPAALSALVDQGGALLLGLEGLEPVLDAAGRLQWTALDRLPAGAETVFLGLLDGRPAFAPLPPAGDAAPATARSIWHAIASLPLEELALYGGARSLVDWHARHRFCARCGQPTALAKGGWQRDCPACAAQHFPRVDPVVIMLVEHENSLLLGRQARFPPRSYSALAGFVEPGETIEEAVAREVLEEAGVAVRDVTYIASQPWPFPSQLMLGCHAFADAREIVIDYTELEDARWFTRAEVAEAMAHPQEGGGEGTSFVPPPARAIAHLMLAWWLEKA
jgi:NAD+ diphosphatase